MLVEGGGLSSFWMETGSAAVHAASARFTALLEPDDRTRGIVQLRASPATHSVEEAGGGEGLLLGRAWGCDVRRSRGAPGGSSVTPRGASSATNRVTTGQARK